LRCLAKKPEDRYGSAAELRRDLLKLRGILAGLDDLTPDEVSSRAHPAFYPGNRGPWQSIGNLREKVLTPFELPPSELEPPSPPHPPPPPGRGTAASPSEVSLSTNELREQYHQALKELAFSLGEAALRSSKMTELLDRLLQLEEEEAALAAQIALMEQNFERIRFETNDLETMLRHAILDLTLERTDLLEGKPNPSAEVREQAQDLQYQIEQLEGRLKEVLGDRSERIQALNQELQDFRQTKAERAWEVGETYIELHNVVEEVRPKASGQELKILYRRADELRERLESTRRSVTSVGGGRKR
jgi:hypothetical protein